MLRARLLRRASCMVAVASAGASSACAQQDAERKAAELHEKWLREEIKADYVPPDASWPPLASRPRRQEIPALRREVLHKCDGASAAHCHQVRLRLAFALLGGVLFGHAEPEALDGEISEAALADGESEGVRILHALANESVPEAALGYGICLMDGHGCVVDAKTWERENLLLLIILKFAKKFF